MDDVNDNGGWGTVRESDTVIDNTDELQIDTGGQLC